MANNSLSVLRPWARVVAIVDMVMLIITFVLGIVHEITDGQFSAGKGSGSSSQGRSAGTSSNSTSETSDGNKDPSPIWVLVLVVIIFIVVYGLYIAWACAIFRLLKATEKGREVNDAHKKTRCYNIFSAIHIAVCIFEFIKLFLPNEGGKQTIVIDATIKFIWRWACIIIVCMYSSELRRMGAV